jgi:hypothetical protein
MLKIGQCIFFKSQQIRLFREPLFKQGCKLPPIHENETNQTNPFTLATFAAAHHIF